MASSAIIRLGAKGSEYSVKSGPDDSPLEIKVTERVGFGSCVQNLANDSLERLDIVVGATDMETLWDPLALAGLSRTLKPGASVSIHVVSFSSDMSSEISLSCALAGLATMGETRTAAGDMIVNAQKPKANLGNNGTARISLRKPFRTTEEEKKTDTHNDNIVFLDADDEYDDGMVDEDNLLSEEFDGGLLSPPPAVDVAARDLSKDDCGGRAACDDCTCGRLEAETSAKPKATQQSSACGNCAKGDAFRCAGCPFLGKPAFKAGEEHLILDLTDDL
eukprot:scaffold9789_cov54-Attheya_sp.AAC.8